MPCYQVNLISVEFKAENLELLKKAIESLGLNFRPTSTIVYAGRMAIDLAGKTITGTNQEQINSLKRAYSKEVVKYTAKKNSWILETKNELNYNLVRY